MNEEWRRICPVCKRKNTQSDVDYPDSMQGCNNCGSEWTDDGEITLNAWEAFTPKELLEHKRNWNIK